MGKFRNVAFRSQIMKESATNTANLRERVGFRRKTLFCGFIIAPDSDRGLSWRAESM
jgi:hypothetical protein